MKKLLASFIKRVFVMALCLHAGGVYAQTPMYYKGTGSGGNTIPMNTNGSHCQQIYVPADFNTTPISGYITKVWFRNTAAGASGTYTNFSVGFLQNNLAAFANSTFLTGFTNALTASSITVNGNAVAGGWYEIPLATPFLYDNSQTLIVEIKYDSKTGGMSNPTSTASGNKRLSIIDPPGPATGNLSTIWGDFGIDVVPAAACTAPPTAGTAVANVASVCSGGNVTLNLSGNSIGMGQMYQWQYSTDGNAPWTNIGTASASTGIVVMQTATRYYRCAVTCSGNTEYSSVVMVTSPALVSGNFTINNTLPSGGSNFQTFAEAISYVQCGINGPVVFDVYPFSSPYTGQVVINAVPGASTTNTITFKGNGAVIDYNTSTTGVRSAIVLNGADHIIIDSLTINANAGSFGWGVTLTGGADSNVIKKCTINLSTSATSTNYAGIVISGSLTSAATSGANGNGNRIDSNIIKGGYYGISVYGSSSANNLNNTIRHNTIEDFYNNAIVATYQSRLVISENNMYRPTRTNTSSSVGALSINTGCTNTLVEKNRVHHLFTAQTGNSTAYYGIYDAADGTAAEPVTFVNNMVYDIEGNGAFYALYNTGAAYMKAYHNTISLDYTAATGGATYGFYQTTSDNGIEFINNIVTITRGGTGAKYCIYKSTATTPLTSNYNVFYINSPSSSTQAIGYQGAAQTLLSNWQTTSGQDANSVSIDPAYVDVLNADLTPTAPSINGIASNLGILTDINNITRATTPDPGAIEFTLPGCTNPPTGGTATTSETIVCSGNSFTLDLTGQSTGTGITYQWQSSPTGTTPWTNIGSPALLSGLNLSQTATTYYRAAVQCNAATPVYSSIILVTTPLAVSGTYTINNNIPTGGSNFASFNDAVNFVKCGINGPVVFNVATGSGPYNEQVTIPQVAGASATNTITFNGNGATLEYLSASTTQRATVKLDGADHIIIDSLSIQASGSTASEYGYAVQLVNNADSNIIRKCTITTTSTPATAASTAFAGIVINSAAATSPTGTGVSECDGNLIEKNTINGGYAGVALTANGTTSSIFNNIISNNSIVDFYTYGVYLNGGVNTLIQNNDFSRPSRSSVGAYYGVYMTGVSLSTKINKNKFHNPFGGNTANTGGAYGVNINVADATAGNETLVSNNLIYEFNGEGTQNAFINTGSDYVKYYHNSISLEDASATTSTTLTRGFYQTTAATGIEFKNNIIKIARGGTGAKECVYFNTATTTFTIDHNVYYNLATGNIGYIGGNTYSTLNDWQTATTQEAHSLIGDPMYVSTNDLHVAAASLVDDKGTAVTGVPDDIDGETRSVSTPDIGADELPPVAGLDIKVAGLVSPAVSAGGCYNTQTITVGIANNSTSAINFATNPVTVNVSVTGAVTATYSAIVNTGTLASAAIQNVTMAVPSGTVDMSALGAYTFNISLVLVGDVNTANNNAAETRTKVALSAGAIAASPLEYCVTGGTPTLTATSVTGQASLVWQQSNTSGSGFTDISGANTNPYTPATAITQTTYYRLAATCGSNTATSAEQVVIVNNPQVTSTTPGYTCGTGTVNLAATASTGATLSWYAAATGGNPIGTGPSFTTPSISSTTVYYVGAGTAGGTATAGRTTPFATSTGFNGNDYGLTFTATQAFTLNSVDVYPTAGAGAITIQLVSGSTVVATAGPFTVPAGTGTTFGTGATPVTLNLGLNIAPGSYVLRSAAHTGSIVRDNPITSVFSYPLPIGSVGSITGGWLGGGASSATYYYFYNWQVSSGCESPRLPVTATVDNSPTCSPVPVRLTAFTGERRGNANWLAWNTAAEINNKGFELQRSADGINYASIAFINTLAENGNSSNALNYTFTDEKITATAGYYYRLKQIDKDGKYNLSNAVFIKGAKVNKLELVQVYPNPANSLLNVKVASPKADNVTFVITDMTGKVVIQQQKAVAGGDNLLQVDLRTLSQGSYLLKAICANGCETTVTKFIKQ